MPPRRAFLLGEGVAHSLSPVMHTAAFAACGIDARYASWEVRREELDQAVARLRRDDCLGANITMPHKRAVVDRADVCSVAVRRCGAGNLLVNRQGRLHLDNTDVLALRTAFTRRARHLARGPVAILGAGGAAAAVLEALRERDTPAVWVLARRPSAAARLVERDRGRLGGRPTVLPLAAAADGRLRDCALVVNATPLGMAADDPSPVPAEHLHPGLLVYDLVYRPGGPTPLQRAAAARGCGVCDGLSHLLEQAGPTFAALTGHPPPRDVMRRALAAAAGRDPVEWGADEAPAAAGSAATG